jgi:hypothetical protein
MFGVISAGLSTIGGAISAAIGGALGSACGAIGEVLRPVLSMRERIITTALNIIGGIGKIFNLIPWQANIESDMTELGARVEKCDVKSDEFASAKDYINHLRNNIDISREEINTISDDKKKLHQILGASLIAKGISENYTMAIPASFWAEAALSSLSSGQVKKMLEGYQALDMPADLKSFSERSLSLADNKSVYGLLADALKEEDSDTTPQTPEDLITQRYGDYQQGGQRA